MDGKPKLRLFSYIVMLYMLLAFIWWSVLLFVKNQDAFKSKAEYMKLVQIAQEKVKNSQEFELSPDYIELKSKYTRQEWMIGGEGLMFILTLIAGIWFINTGYHKEIKLAQQKRNFLLSISHELKSPLAAIKLILETFKNPKLNSEHTNFLIANGLKENERLNALVNNLLLATRLETSYIPQKEKLDLLDLIKSSLIQLELLFPKIQIDFQTIENECVFFGEKLALESLVNNLLENAVKYSSGDSKIQISLQKQLNRYILKVSDLGIGISAKEKKNIFQRFYRIGNEDTRTTKGTGLGLYIVKQIVDAHNGVISVKNNFPKGTIFEVELPIENSLNEI